MRILFSLIALLIVVGLVMWWSSESLEEDTGLISPQIESDGSAQETPTEKALEVKKLIESRNTVELQQ